MSHSYSNNYVHVVYSTKDRKDLIPTKFEKRLYSFIASIAREHKIALLAAGGMPNHSHLLFLLPATTSLAYAINIFKTNSSRFMHERGLAFQ
jgi:putative transposase